mmetsp:Transcript_27108/g.35544  ORF Transcript_27108/g.35544 Transcript_27108/m.35544 type:complete len:327 (+) Transcript_27108:64-1044(+)
MIMAHNESARIGGNEYTGVRRFKRDIKVVTSSNNEVSEIIFSILEDGCMVDGLGGEVWDGAFFLSKFLEDLEIRGLRVIDLGTGTGVCGFVCSVLGAKEVILTDEFIDLAEENTLNFLQEFPNNQVQCQTLVWGEESPLLSKSFDLVLGSELTPMKSTHEVLVQTLRVLLNAACTQNGQVEEGVKSHPFALFTLDLCQISMEADCQSTRCAAHHFVRMLKKYNLDWELIATINSEEIKDVHVSNNIIRWNSAQSVDSFSGISSSCHQKNLDVDELDKQNKSNKSSKIENPDERDIKVSENTDILFSTTAIIKIKVSEFENSLKSFG